MFFILWEFTQLIKKGISGIGAAMDDANMQNYWDRKRESGEWKSPTWIDRKGVERNIYTNEIQHTQRINGDRVLTNMYGDVIKNFSQEERDRKYSEAKQNRKDGVTAIKWKDGGDPKCEGTRYKDLDTGRIMVARNIGTKSQTLSFFMDATTGEYLRPTDFQYWLWKEYSSIEEGEAKAKEMLNSHIETRLDIFGWDIDKFDNCYDPYCTALTRR